MANVAATSLLPRLLGLAILDVVEGSAIEAMQNMRTYFDKRPDKFKNMEQAIRWQYD